MAIAVDTVSGQVRFSAAVTSPVTQTATHVVGGSATYAVLFIEAGLAGGVDTNITLSALTLGGNAFTHLGSALKHSGSDSDTFGFVDVYTLASPPTGSQTLSITMAGQTGGAGGYLMGYSVSYTGAFNASPLGTAKTSNGQNVSSLTLTDTLATGDLLVGICANGAAAPTMTTGTSDLTATGSTNTGCDNVRLAHNSGTGSVSIVYATNSGDYSAASGVKLAAAGGATFIAPAAININQTVNTSRYF